MTTRNITKIKPTSLANTLSLIYGSFGAVVALIQYLAAKGLAYTLGYIVGALLVGYITGFVGAYIYNFFVKYTGGIQVEVSE
jgi:drug/metabolite transporter (DMT)-like permease